MKRGIIPGLIGIAALAGPIHAQQTATVASSRQLQNENDLKVHVRFGVAELRMTRDQGNALYRASVVYNKEDFEAFHEYSASSRSLELGVKPLRDNIDTDQDELQTIDLALAPTVPTSLELEFGAGRAELDLGGMSLQKAEIQTGASETLVQFSRPTLMPCEQIDIAVGAAEFRAEGLGNSNCQRIEVNAGAGSLTLDFTGEWQHHGVTNANITIGLGGLTLRFPSHLGVAVELDRFLASFDDAGFVKRGDKFYSTGYDDAAAKLHVDLKAVIGDVDVVWVQR